ncbi:MAG: ABC transporter permease [Actinomycetota bacterium]|nr:ABC transporter permease [Actinomycetota bacterium]
MLPIFVMILFGFNNTTGRFNFAWQGFTLQWYRDLFAIQDLTTAVRNSLIIAVVATIIATVLGTMIALALARYRFRGKAALNLVMFTNIAAPEVVVGASLLALFVTTNISRGLGTILIAHVMFNIAYVAITVEARLAGFDRSLEDAAADLGATPWAAFWKVIFPLISPGVLAGALLAFALSIDDYIITSFVAGQTQMFPTWVFGASRLGIPPQVNVMGTLIFAFGALLAVANVFWQRRSARLEGINVALLGELKG